MALHSCSQLGSSRPGLSRPDRTPRKPTGFPNGRPATGTWGPRAPGGDLHPQGGRPRLESKAQDRRLRQRHRRGDLRLSPPRFSIRAPVRGATGPVHRHPQVEAVSIRAPVRGATGPRCRPRWPFRRFNPRPRAGGDPARDRPSTQQSSFNPRPRAGGDLFFRGGEDLGGVFQSAPPRGGRLILGQHLLQLIGVSIRARARGATFRTIHQTFPPLSFNPRPRAGGDSLSPPGSTYKGQFQSAPPRGGRLTSKEK